MAHRSSCIILLSLLLLQATIVCGVYVIPINQTTLMSGNPIMLNNITAAASTLGNVKLNVRWLISGNYTFIIYAISDKVPDYQWYWRAEIPIPSEVLDFSLDWNYGPLPPTPTTLYFLSQPSVPGYPSFNVTLNGTVTYMSPPPPPPSPTPRPTTPPVPPPITTPQPTPAPVPNPIPSNLQVTNASGILNMVALNNVTGLCVTGCELKIPFNFTATSSTVMISYDGVQGSYPYCSIEPGTLMMFVTSNDGYRFYAYVFYNGRFVGPRCFRLSDSASSLYLVLEIATSYCPSINPYDSKAVCHDNVNWGIVYTNQASGYIELPRDPIVYKPDYAPLIIGICVGVPVLIGVLITAVVIVATIIKKRQKQKRIKEQQDMDVLLLEEHRASQ